MRVGKLTLVFLATLMCCHAADLWQSASFYQIYIPSFQDSNGDGVGDLKGITQRLQYLNEIRVKAIVLSPIFVTPKIYSGYNVDELTAIDRLFGTMADFEALVKQAKRLDLKIILDFVPNHTSDECAWFLKSEANYNLYKDFYIWHPGKIVKGVRQPPTNWISVYGNSTWTYNTRRKAYYLHQFHAKQPDLNYRNPVVVQTMKDVLRFWLRKGVSGFRMNAVPYIFETAADPNGNYPDEPRNFANNDAADYDYYQHIYTKDQPETVDMIYQFRSVMDEMKMTLGQKDDFILITEAYTSLPNVMQFYGNKTRKGAEIPSNFELISNINKHSTASDYERLINNWLNTMPEGGTANWVMGNPDQSRVATRLGEDMIDIINMLLMTLPGCSFTYQGEEIGMSDVWLSWKDTQDPRACQSNPPLTCDPARSPFQWNDKPFAGFTHGKSTWLPVANNYSYVNVQSERNGYLSHLNVYKRVISLRFNPVFRYGSTEVKALSQQVLAVKRSLHFKTSFITLLNLGNDTEGVNLNSYFANLTSTLKYVVINRNSSNRHDQVISPSLVNLNPKEAVILKTL